MKKVTGMGGIFFKCKNPGMVKEWYSQNLGFVSDEYGSMFECVDADTNSKVYTQ